MIEPLVSRPYMPGYGVVDEGRGLLPWSWADERLTRSPNYWVASRRPDGRPHVMPVWGWWDGAALWFGSSIASRKARNLRADSRCSVATDNAKQPVVVEGNVEVVNDLDRIAAFVDAGNEKYAASLPDGPMTVEFFDPAVNATFVLKPTWVFTLDEDDFTNTPTRWVFDV